jgi:hypothetical protein
LILYPRFLEDKEIAWNRCVLYTAVDGFLYTSQCDKEELPTAFTRYLTTNGKPREYEKETFIVQAWYAV